MGTGTISSQDLFDRVAWHLIGQGEQSIGVVTIKSKNKVKSRNIDREEHRYMYYGPSGLKSAVGSLIQRRKYKVGMEGSLRSLLERYPNAFTFDVVPHRVLLEKLEKIHDRIAPEYWVEALYELASQRKLNTDMLDIILVVEDAE
jgi:hypothetical protein